MKRIRIWSWVGALAAYFAAEMFHMEPVMMRLTLTFCVLLGGLYAAGAEIEEIRGEIRKLADKEDK